MKKIQIKVINNLGLKCCDFTLEDVFSYKVNMNALIYRQSFDGKEMFMEFNDNHSLIVTDVLPF